MRTVKLSRHDLFPFDSRYAIYGAYVALTDVVPHTTTVRASRTLAADERGQVMSGYLFLMRKSAPTTAGVATAFFDIQGHTLLADLSEITTAVGNARYVVVPAGAVIPAGHTIRLVTADASTGGTYDYSLGYNIIVTSVV